MKNITILWLIQVLFFSACQEKKEDQAAQLKDVLVGYFDGIETRDFKKMSALTTEDFIIYEDGVIFTNDSIFKMIESFPKYTAKYKFEKLNIQVDQSSGNIHYLNHANFVFNDTTKVAFDWLESATFKKIDGQWKMNFLHSTVRK
ncbi:nuclear transport factor 2 family protein [Polaribacter sp.]|uniref:nuclear transport factor 2 family protein n=1 Tax=Polaribacter sp. TaxID=1920175 RepID=UPI003EF3B480